MPIVGVLVPFMVDSFLTSFEMPTKSAVKSFFMNPVVKVCFFISCFDATTVTVTKAAGKNRTSYNLLDATDLLEESTLQ